jgi:transposase-like protein
MQRRKFSREFKVEAVRLVKERSVSVAQAARDLAIHENVLRKWVKLVRRRSGAGLSRPWADEARTAGDRTAAPRSCEAQGRAGYLKKLSSAVARLCGVETALCYPLRLAAVSLLEALSPLKNVVHGRVRT